MQIAQLNGRNGCQKTKVKMRYRVSVTYTFLPFVSLLLVLPLSNGKTWKEDLTLTSKEKRKLEEFKVLVGDKLPHDYMKKDIYLIRWLRAKYFNMHDAESMLKSHLKWRKDNQMDNILKEDWSEYEGEYKFYLEGKDKEGKPLLYVNAGSWDLRRAIVSGSRAKFERYIDKGLEEACNIVRDMGEKGLNVSQGILILNLDGFNVVQHACLNCISTFLRIIVQYEAHYPGCADKIIAVNLPQAAVPILNAAKKAFHPETNKSLLVYGTNKSVWRDALKQWFNDDQLPPELGGTCVFKGMENDNEDDAEDNV